MYEYFEKTDFFSNFLNTSKYVSISVTKKCKFKGCRIIMFYIELSDQFFFQRKFSVMSQTYYFFSL